MNYEDDYVSYVNSHPMYVTVQMDPPANNDMKKWTLEQARTIYRKLNATRDGYCAKMDGYSIYMTETQRNDLAHLILSRIA